MALHNTGLQQAQGQSINQMSAYATAAIPKQPTAAESLSQEIREQISGIDHHTERLEGFANRLCGAQPKEATTGLGGPPLGNSHADGLTGFRNSLTALGARLNEAVNRLESFI